MIIADADQPFSQVTLSDTCIDAANRTGRRFDRNYPGWELYSRIVRGDTVFDRQLAAWAIGCARAYTRARKVNGQAVVAPRGRRNDWIAQAALDALECTITGYYADGLTETAHGLGVNASQYRRFRGAITAMMLDGFEEYRAELHYQYHRVRRDEAAENYFGPTVNYRKSPLMLGTWAANFGLSANGCYGIPGAPESSDNKS